jgi:hypothetical protein
MAEMTINLNFTGICIFVWREGDNRASVILPNARNAGHGGGAYRTEGTAEAHSTHCAPGHVAFVEFDPKQKGIDSAASIFLRYGGPLANDVVVLSLEGVALSITDAGNKSVLKPGAFTFAPTHMIEFGKISPGSTIDGRVAGDFDPLEERVNATVLIETGDVAAVSPGARNVLEFRSKALGENVIRRAFAQQVVWRIKLPQSGTDDYFLGQRKLGGDSFSPLVKFGAAGAEYAVTIGNAPFEDILRTPIGIGDLLDQHFAVYYDYLRVRPDELCLPVRVSAFEKRTRTGGADCPPTLMTR